MARKSVQANKTVMRLVETAQMRFDKAINSYNYFTFFSGLDAKHTKNYLSSDTRYIVKYLIDRERSKIQTLNQTGLTVFNAPVQMPHYFDSDQTTAIQKFWALVCSDKDIDLKKIDEFWNIRGRYEVENLTIHEVKEIVQHFVEVERAMAAQQAPPQHEYAEYEVI